MEDLTLEGLTGYYLGGGEITCCTLVKEDLYVAVKSHLLVYSTRNAALLHVQKLGSSEVTGLSPSPTNSQQLLVTSRDGTVSVWDMTDWTLMRTVTAGSSVSHLLVSRSAEHIFLVTRGTESGNTITKIQKHCASTLSHISDSLIIKKPCDNFRISSCGNFILFTRDTRVRVINTCTCATFTRFTHDTDLCATALHPTRNIAAVADVDGRICFLNDWNVKGSVEGDVQHWHANRVGGMGFAPRSDVLFSGGAESVLVKWLDGQPQFLPRIGGGIQHVLCPESGDIVVLVTQDTAIHIVSLNTWTVKFKLCNILKRPRNTCSKTRATTEIASSGTDVVFSSTPGNLQVYDVEKREHKRIVDITNQNQSTGHTRNKTLSYIDITHLKISFDEEWLVTVERRDDGFVTPENRLKFWRRQETGYTLKTCVDPPHTKLTTSLSLGLTASPTAVTTSTDCTVKVWVCGDDEDKWTEKQVLKHRHGPAYNSVISDDGSVIVVGYKGVIVLYGTDKWEVKAEVPQLISRMDQIFLSGYYLLNSAKDLISVWDLTSVSLCWEVSANVSYILGLPDKTFLAFIARKSVTDAYLFGVKSAAPLAVHKFVCPGVVEGACVVDGGEKVVMLNNQHELYTLSHISPPPLATAERQHADTATVFTQLLKIAAPTVTPPEFKHNSSATVASSVLNVPSNAMPPLSAICANVLSDFLPQKTSFTN